MIIPYIFIKHPKTRYKRFYSMTQDTIDTILRNQFGIKYLRPFQELIIKHILESEENGSNGNIIAILPTGGGKSLCFMLPILVIKKLTIIIYPLISLMNDQRKRFEEAGISYELLKGGMSRDERKAAIKRLESGTSIAMLTNVEMLHFLVASKELHPLYGNVSMLVVDEAHTVEAWGNTFRPSYKKINEIRKKLNPRHTLAFTATLDKKDLHGIEKSIFNSEGTYTIRASSDRENIFYHTIRSLNKEREIENILKDTNKKPAIVFARSRNDAEKLAHILSNSFNTRYYHAGLDNEKKKEVEKWFSQTKDAVLMATIAFGLGVDAKGTRTVIHHYLPQDATNFLQEAGRAGRDGKDADSYVLYYPWEESQIKQVFDQEGCIRSKLLNLMDEQSDVEACLGCSHCVPDSYKRVGEEQIVGYIRKHKYKKDDDIASYMTNHTIWGRKKRLRTWSNIEIKKALSILQEEGLIKSANNRYTVKNDNSLIWFCIHCCDRIKQKQKEKKRWI